MARDDDEDFEDAQTVEGGDEARGYIRNWLKIISKSTEVEGAVDLELWNVGKGAEDAIYSTEWDISEPMEDVINEVLEAAEEDALAIGRGTIRFKLIVPDRKKFGRAAFTLRVPNTRDIDTDDFEDIEELATRKGLMTQLMRHQEKTMKVGLAGSDKVMAHMSRMLDSAHARIRELEGRYLDNAKTYEELLSGKHARDLEIRKLENEEKQKQQVVGILMQGIPLLITKFLGSGGAPSPAAQAATPEPGKPFDEPVTPLELMIEGFMATFTPQQLQDIMQKNVLTPEQLVMFVEIAKVIQARHEAREANKAPAA